MPLDPYNDGLALRITLDRAPTEADTTLARRLLSEWLAPYEEPTTQHYRNAGVAVDAGKRHVYLWADRIADPGGEEEARRRAELMLERVGAEFRTKRVRLETADVASDLDMELRLGGPVVQVRPRGTETLLEYLTSPIWPDVKWTLGVGVVVAVERGLGATWGTALVTIAVLESALVVGSLEHVPRRARLAGAVSLATTWLAFFVRVFAESERAQGLALTLAALAWMAWVTVWRPRTAVETLTERWRMGR